MESIRKKLKAFWKEEEGLTMVEYAIAGSLVAAASVVAFTGLGNAVIARITQLAGFVNPAG